MSLKASTLIVLALAALAALAAVLWFGRDQPAVQQALPAALRDALRQAPAPALPQVGTVAQPRKCRGGSQVVYTDGPCPAGTHERALAGGSVTALPASPAPAPAASAVTPLRRLAGEGALPDKAERSVEQALQR